jgi:hypothetical protein
MRVRQARTIAHKPYSLFDDKLVACMVSVRRHHRGVILPMVIRMVAVLNPASRPHEVTAPTTADACGAGAHRPASHPIQMRLPKWQLVVQIGLGARFESSPVRPERLRVQLPASYQQVRGDESG